MIYVRMWYKLHSQDKNGNNLNIVPDCFGSSGTEMDNSIPKLREREGNGKRQFGNGKGRKKSMPKFWEREENEKKAFPKFEIRKYLAWVKVSAPNIFNHIVLLSCSSYWCWHINYQQQNDLTYKPVVISTWSTDQGLTAETCCAEENRMNYQTEGFEGLSTKRSGKTNKEGCLFTITDTFAA